MSEVRSLEELIYEITGERKQLEGKALCSQHALHMKEYQCIQAYLVENFGCYSTNYNKENGYYSVNLTISF